MYRMIDAIQFDRSPLFYDVQGARIWYRFGPAAGVGCR